MYRSLAIIIAVAIATSPVMGEDDTFYDSLRVLGTHCKRQASLSAQQGKLSPEANRQGLFDFGICLAWLQGIKAGLPYDLDNPEILCIKNLKASGAAMVDAFAQYHEAMEKTPKGRILLRDFETAPGLFTALALAKIYGCTETDDRDTSILAPMDGYAPPKRGK
jgi:hypothetical protein